MLIRRAAAVLPKEHAQRHIEEWYRELEEIPDGPITRLLWVALLVVQRGSLARALGVPRSEVGFAGGVKRFLDISVVAAGIFVISPLLLAIALAVKLEDGGPVIFRHTRVGRGGETFTMYKFRTMVIDAEARKADLESLNETHGALFKLSGDPRVTRLGRFLRAFSLDELPQLFNVLGGSMSLVGPRPHLAEEIARMPDEAVRRSLVTPGMTGLWQIAGRSNLSVEDSIRLDLRYAENWSVALDLLIMFKTAFAVMARRD
jgi:lipopolysaccharide/colanic/teichoic acid biosynthesis glycosyltransferase